MSSGGGLVDQCMTNGVDDSRKISDEHPGRHPDAATKMPPSYPGIKSVLAGILSIVFFARDGAPVRLPGAAGMVVEVLELIPLCFPGADVFGGVVGEESMRYRLRHPLRRYSIVDTQ